jgi:CubicO group peptidase (beta-lactamase class C family)
MTAVLRLVADGRVGIDAPANGYLRSVRLVDDTVTVRELLANSSPVDAPLAGPLMADSVPGLTELAGPVIACGGSRGVLRPNNGGYAVLGQLIADVTGMSYPDAVARLVLDPLGMTRSAFPARVADLTPDAVTGYEVLAEGVFEQVPASVVTLPAVGGMRAPAAEVLRLGACWASLLPAALAREALTPQGAPGPEGLQPGLGWLLTRRGDVALHSGALPGAAALLLRRIPGGQVYLTMTTRFVPIDPVTRRVLRQTGV